MLRFNFSERWSRLRQRLFGWWRRGPQVGAPEAMADDQRLILNLSGARIPNRRQWRYVGTVLTAPERLWVQWLSFTAIVAVLVLLGGWFSRHFVWAPVGGGSLTEGVVGTPQYINPVLARQNTVDADLTKLTFRGLMAMNKDFQLVPDLAKSVDVSADGKTYTITLQKNLRWSDDEPLTAHDVEYTISTIADATFKSPLQTVFQGVTVEATDNQTVIFRLPQPLAPFLSYLTVGILPEHTWSDALPQTFALNELNLKPISNGPFTFRSLMKDRDGNIKALQFERNEKYAGAAPYLDKVTVKFYPDYASALAALQSHAIDALGDIQLVDVAAAEKISALQSFALSELTAVFLNQKTNGALRSKDVRIALSQATDRQAIIDRALQGRGQAIVGPILPGYLGYNPDLKRFAFQLEQANQTLENTGWKKTDSGIRQKGSQQLTFTFTVVNQPILVAVAQQLVKDWKQVGAQIELKIVEPTEVQKSVIRPRNYEALLFGQIFDTDPDPYQFWHSSQQRESGFNLSIFFSKKIDQDLEDGRRNTSNVQRGTDYFDFQNVVAEEIPAIFLYQNNYLYAHPRSLRGFSATRIVSSSDRFQHIETWYSQTRPHWK